MEPQKIKFFISSSYELKEERDALSNFALELNAHLCDKGIVVEPVLWEMVDPGQTGESKQDEYNEKVKECIRCIVMFWTKVGKYTREELDLALSQARKKENPQRVDILFKYDDIAELDEHEDVKNLHEQLNGDRMFPENFSRSYNLDSLRQKFINYLQLELKPLHVELKVVVEDGRAMIDGKPYVELNKLNCYAKSEDYRDLLKAIQRTKKLLNATDADDPEYMDYKRELADYEERKQQMERNIWDTSLELTRMVNESCSERLKRAIALMEDGKFREADTLLKEEELQADAERYHRQIDTAREGISNLVKEYKTKINAKKSMMMLGWSDEVIRLYQQMLDVARGYVEDSDWAEMLFDFGLFMYNQRHFGEAEPLYRESLEVRRRLAESDPEANLAYVATSLNNLAILHEDTNCYSEAESEYLESLAIHRKLAESDSNAYLADVAFSLNNLAALHYDTYCYSEAEEEYLESLSICRKFAESNPDDYLAYVATISNNLADLHRETNRYSEAEAECLESLSIRRKLAESNPDAYLADVALSLNMLANIHVDTNRYSEAEVECLESLSIRRKLAESNPDAYLDSVATSLNNLAILHEDTNRYSEAESEYLESLSIRRKLAESNPDAYLAYVAKSLNDLADLHRETNRYSEAEMEFMESLLIFRKLADSNPDVYLVAVAQILRGMALIHYSLDRYSEAVAKYLESLSIYRTLAESNPDVYLNDVAMTLVDLRYIYTLMNNTSKAAEVKKELDEVRQKMEELGLECDA